MIHYVRISNICIWKLYFTLIQPPIWGLQQDWPAGPLNFSPQSLESPGWTQNLVWNDRELRSGTTEGWRPGADTAEHHRAGRAIHKIDTQRWQPFWANPQFQTQTDKGTKGQEPTGIPFCSHQTIWDIEVHLPKRGRRDFHPSIIHPLYRTTDGILFHRSFERFWKGIWSGSLSQLRKIYHCNLS